MRTGEEHDITVETVDDEAVGQSHLNSMTLKIGPAAPGDTVRVRIVHISPHRPVAWCEIQKIISRGPHFVDPPCRHAAAAGGGCTGCPAMHLDAQTVEDMKTSRVRNALAGCRLKYDVSYVPSVKTLEYRNRGHFVASRNNSGRGVLGAYRERSHTVVPLDDCPVLRPAVRQVLRCADTWLNAPPIPIFPEPDGLRYVTFRASTEGAVLIDLVTTGEHPPWMHPLAEQLMSLPSVAGVSYTVNNEAGNALRTAPSIPLTGQLTVTEHVGNLSLKLAASSFSQLNSDVAAQMYTRAASMAGEVFCAWDLYCGAGGLGLSVLAGQSATTQLFGADSIQAAIDLAETNAAEYPGRVVYQTVDLARQMPTFHGTPDIVLVNPPRKGLDKPVHRFFETTATRSLIYMSCNPQTFARDVARLTETGFVLEAVFAYDMLPCTAHVEVIGKLTRTPS